MLNLPGPPLRSVIDFPVIAAAALPHLRAFHVWETFLSQKDLARRWGISNRILERWRWLGTGPLFLKVGARVAYRMRDVERHEATRLRQSGPTAIARRPPPESE